MMYVEFEANFSAMNSAEARTPGTRMDSSGRVEVLQRASAAREEFASRMRVVKNFLRQRHVPTGCSGLGMNSCSPLHNFTPLAIISQDFASRVETFKSF